MGLIKNWADVNGTKHQVDPTGHSHSNDSWFTTAIAACEKIANKITSWGTPTNTQYPSAKLVKDSLDAKAASNHTHSTSESWLSTIVNNLTTLINGKAATVHTHTKSQITDFAHTHSSIVGEYQTEYVRLYNNHVEMQGELVEIYASEQQGGNINLKVSKEEGGSITASIHEYNIGKLNNVLAGTIPQSDVSGLSSALDGKAASTHTHTKSQITDFAHTHTQSDVTGLTTALSGKVDKNRVSANHPIYTGGLTIHYEMGESVTLNNEGSSQTDCSTPIKLNLGDKIRILNTRGCKTSIYALNGDMFSFINGHTITRLVKEEGVGNYAEYTSASEDYYVILACYQNGHSITEHTYEITRAN